MTFNYFRAFYLAKAGTELWLTEVYNRDSGFESRVQSWDAIVSWNLVWNYAWFNPYFTMDIQSNFEELAEDIRFGCEDWNRIILLSWDWVVIPLFKDNTTWIKNILSGGGYFSNLSSTQISNLNLKLTEDRPVLTFWFFKFDNDWNLNDRCFQVKTWSSLTGFISGVKSDCFWDRMYLTIKNSSNSTVEFCVEWGKNQKIPYSDAIVTVRGNYGDMEVGLQSVVKRVSPWWSLNVLGQISQ